MPPYGASLDVWQLHSSPSLFNLMCHVTCQTVYKGVPRDRETCVSAAMFTVASLCLLATVALAQEPHPCESPRQFEGRFSIYDNDRNFRAFGRFAYDDTNRRFRETEEMEIGRDREYYDRLYLHNLNLEYRMDLRTRNCTVSTLTRPWIPFAVPQDARFRGEGVIGASGIPDEHVTIANFDGTADGNPYFIIATVEDCVPVTAGFFSNRTGGVLRQFYDITLGLRDPDAFIPPQECHTV